MYVTQKTGSLESLDRGQLVLTLSETAQFLQYSSGNTPYLLTPKDQPRKGTEVSLGGNYTLRVTDHTLNEKINSI